MDRATLLHVILRLAVLIQYRSVTDTQTDRQIPDDGIYRASIGLRGKKISNNLRRINFIV